MESQKLRDYFGDMAGDSEGMPKALLKNMVKELRHWQGAQGQKPVEAEMNMALFITSAAMMNIKQWNGNDYMEHPITVGFMRTDSYTKKIVGILHDLVEDTDWTLQDLREVGFSDEIVDAVDSVTKRDGETYFDFAVRCGLNRIGLDVKIADLKHNMDISRSAALPDFNDPRAMRMIEKQNKVYPVTLQYLVSIKKKEIAAGTSIEDFMAQKPAFCDYGLLKRWGTPKNGGVKNVKSSKI